MITPHRLALLLASCSLYASSFACNCAGQGSVKAGVEAASVVFTGRVLKLEYSNLAESIDPDSLAIARSLPHEGSKNYLDSPMMLKATLVVTTDFKGVAKNDTIIVYTGIRGATCGFKFEANKEYTVYATTENYMFNFFRLDRQRFRNFSKRGVYWTSICSRTTIAVGQEQGLLNEHFQKK
jgi:hypothetical protein